METIDWRKLYESNRAVIEGRSRRLHGHRSPPAARPALAAPAPHARTAPRMEPPPARGAHGSWEELGLSDGRHPGRAYVYAPRDLPTAAPVALLVMLHGCTQTAAGFAFASRMNEAADRHGFVVLYPEQSRSANAQSCWNWFVAAQQQRAGVEASFIAAATRTAMHGARWTVDPARVYLVGMSAGGAMASVVAATHPDLYAALAVHSGLAFGCATHLGAARAAMTQGAPDAEELGRAAHRAMGDHAQPVPALVIHGDADRIVCPINGDQVARQWLVTNRLAGGGEADLAFDSPTAVERQHGGARAATRRRWADAGGRLMAEHLLVHGLGHAWSGGAAGGSYTDPHGPSAVDAIWGFFARACHGRAATVG